MDERLSGVHAAAGNVSECNWQEVRWCAHEAEGRQFDNEGLWWASCEKGRLVMVHGVGGLMASWSWCRGAHLPCIWHTSPLCCSPPA